MTPKTEHSDLPRKSSAIVRKRLCGLRTIFRGSSEIFAKWSEILRKLSKRLYYQQNYTLLLVDMEYLFWCSTSYLTRWLHPLVRYRVEHSRSTRARIIILYLFSANIKEIPTKIFHGSFQLVR